MNTILPATALANNGLCALCVGERKRREREQFIQENRREVDPYAGLTDPVDIITVIHTQRKYDPLIQYTPPPVALADLYNALSPADAERLIDICLAALRSGNLRLAELIAAGLARFTDYSLDRMLIAFVDSGQFYPPVIFRNAGPAVRDAIIRAVETSRANTNNALLALAWIGDAAVQTRFELWDLADTPWKRELFINPADYAKEAGWELVNSTRRNLFFQQCFAIVPNDGNTVRGVAVMKLVDQLCPWCGRNLVHLVELDLSDPRFSFLPFLASKLAVLTCEACTLYTTISAENPGGAPQWAPWNTKPSMLPDHESPEDRSVPNPWRDVPVTLQRRRAIEAVDWSMDLTTISQIGGIPSWVQGAAFPICPSCNETMCSVAQVDNGAFPGYEGVYYAFFCPQCLTTATMYQQS